MWKYALVYSSGEIQIWLLVKDGTSYRFVNENERKIMPPIFSTVDEALDILDMMQANKVIKEWECVT